jgi:hypothetical protein
MTYRLQCRFQLNFGNIEVEFLSVIPFEEDKKARKTADLPENKD